MAAARKKKATQKEMQIKALKRYADEKAAQKLKEDENLPFRPDPRVAAAVNVSKSSPCTRKLKL